MDLILDYLPISDMFAVAQTSHKMQEMVYDDARWVKRLRHIGVWNEEQAKNWNRKDHGEAVNIVKLAGKDIECSYKPHAAGWSKEHDAIESDFVTEQTSAVLATKGFGGVLNILAEAQSIRGQGRKQYGKIYLQLYPYCKNIVKLFTTIAQKNVDHETGWKYVFYQSRLFPEFKSPENHAQMIS